MAPSMLSPTVASRLVTPAGVLAAFAAAACLPATPADAAALPAARFIEGIGTSSDTPPNGAHGRSDALAETIAYSARAQNGNGAADLAGTVTTKNGASPSLEVEASAFGSAFYIVSSAEVDYSLVVAGPASAVPVPVIVTFSGFGSAGATSGGDGTLEITSFGTRFLVAEPVPEPGTGALLGLGAGVLAALRRRRGQPAPAG